MTTRKNFPKAYADAVTLGTGGMAKVYRARQKNLNRDVAIKVLLSQYARDSGIRARFEREARYAAALHHEGIVPIYDFIKEGGTAFMVMEYVDGIDLRKIIMALGAIPHQVAALIAVRVLRALEYAHRRGIIHRDIKPGNVLIGKRGEVKLTDFGIAKDPSKPEDNLTRTGTALGTPTYMSPEQILGDDMDFRSDLFSFGILFYEMLTGERPFKGDTEGKLLKAISNGSYKDVRRVNRRVPWALARVVRRCLKRDVRRRYRDTEAGRRQLEKYVYRVIPGALEDHLAEWLDRTGLFVENTAVLVKEDDDTAHAEELKKLQAKTNKQPNKKKKKKASKRRGKKSTDSEVPEWTVPAPLATRARFLWATIIAIPAIVALVWPTDAGKQAATPTPSPTAVRTPAPTPTSTPEGGADEVKDP